MHLHKIARSMYRFFWGGLKRVLLPNATRPYLILAGPGRGIRLRMNLTDGGIRPMVGLYEPPLMRFLERALFPGAIAFDIGSNVGLIALIMAKRVGPTGRVFAFEPVPDFLREMDENIKLNPTLAERITIMPYFVGDRQELAGGFCSLDGLFQSGKIPLADVVKMDIEGGEQQALPGMENMASRKMPRLFVECHLSPEVEKGVADFFERHHAAMARSMPSALEITRVGFNAWVYTKPD